MGGGGLDADTLNPSVPVMPQLLEAPEVPMEAVEGLQAYHFLLALSVATSARA